VGRARARRGAARIRTLLLALVPNPGRRGSDPHILGTPLAPMSPTTPTPATARHQHDAPPPFPILAAQRRMVCGISVPCSIRRRRTRARQVPPPLPRSWQRDGQGRPTTTTASSPAPSPDSRGAALLPLSLPPRHEFDRELPTATGCRNDMTRICGGATKGATCSMAVEPSTSA
jgi:hypothetical protein